MSKNLKPFVVILLLAGLSFLTTSYKAQQQKIHQQESFKTDSKNQYESDCDQLALNQDDQLAILLNQPEENKDLCLFVGCNSFF